METELTQKHPNNKHGMQKPHFRIKTLQKGLEIYAKLHSASKSHFLAKKYLGKFSLFVESKQGCYQYNCLNAPCSTDYIFLTMAFNYKILILKEDCDLFHNLVLLTLQIAVTIFNVFSSN